MKDRYVDPNILERFNELIAQGRAEFEQLKTGPDGKFFRDPVWVTRWTTSCLNLLDRLSLSTNRFVTEFERYGRTQGDRLNLALPLGVLEAARNEYERGFAVDYHLGVAATVFSDLLAQAEYLLEKAYLQAAAVLVGAALEESLRSRAKVERLELDGRETLVPLIEKLVKSGTLTPFEADRLRGVAKMRNEAAHGRQFPYGEAEVRAALVDARTAISRILDRAT